MSKAPVNLQRISHAAILLALVIFTLIVAENLLVPLAFGILFAFVLLPVCNFYERYLRNRIISILLSFATVLLPILGVGVFFGFEFVRLVRGIPSIGRQLQNGLNDAIDWLETNLNLDAQDITEWVRNNLSTVLDAPLSFITSSLSSSTTVIAGLVLITLYTFFALLYRTSLRNFFIYQFGPQTRTEADELLRDIQHVMQEYLAGLSLVIFILGLLNSGGLWLIGIDYALFWGFLAALLAIIPYIGTTLGGLFPFLYALATTDTFWQPAAVVLLYATVQQLEGNVITPKVVGSSVKINPFAAILSLIVGGMIWGIAGLILAIPFMAALRVIFSHIDFLMPVGELLGDKLYRNSDVFAKKYDADRYRLITFFRRIDRQPSQEREAAENPENTPELKEDKAS